MMPAVRRIAGSVRKEVTMRKGYLAPRLLHRGKLGDLTALFVYKVITGPQ